MGMAKKNVHTKTNRGMLTCAIWCLLVLFGRLLHSERANQPGVLRNIRLGLELFFKNSFPGLHAWYHDGFFAPFVMWLISAIPFLLLILLVAKRFSLLQRIPRHWFDGSKCKTIIKKDIPKPRNPIRMQTQPQRQPASTQRAPASAPKTAPASERLSALQNLCGDVNGENNIFAGDRGVRMQVLSKDPRQRIDQILEWYGPEGAKAATFPITPQYELLLNMDHRGVPCLVGLSDTGEGGEHNWTENIHPLTREEPMMIKRQSGPDTVDRYAITWLGGRNHD